MTAPSAHQVDVFAAFLTIIGWLFLLLLLEQVEDPRVRWARLVSFGPLHQAYDRLPREWGTPHAVLVVATALWLGAVLVPTSKLRPRLLVATATCLTFLATAWALHPCLTAAPQLTFERLSLSGLGLSPGAARTHGVARLETRLMP